MYISNCGSSRGPESRNPAYSCIQLLRKAHQIPIHPPAPASTRNPSCCCDTECERDRINKMCFTRRKIILPDDATPIDCSTTSTSLTPTLRDHEFIVHQGLENIDGRAQTARRRCQYSEIGVVRHSAINHTIKLTCSESYIRFPCSSFAPIVAEVPRAAR